MKALKKAIGDTVLTPLSSIPVFLKWQIWSINDPLVGFQTTMMPICAQTISYWGEHQVQFLRAHSAIRRILVIYRFEFCQKKVDSFWKKWAVPRKRGHVQRRNVAVDDFVIVADANPLSAPPTQKACYTSFGNVK